MNSSVIVYELNKNGNRKINAWEESYIFDSHIN